VVEQQRADECTGHLGLRFPKPGGGEIALSEWRGAPLLINFWATWCPPCVEEMPLLARFQKAHRADGWRILGLAVDKEKPVQEFVTSKGIDFAIALAGNEGLALSRSLETAPGAYHSASLSAATALFWRGNWALSTKRCWLTGLGFGFEPIGSTSRKMAMFAVKSALPPSKPSFLFCRPRPECLEQELEIPHGPAQAEDADRSRLRVERFRA
jgi:thiol-disulfide isomerase/thioredoxin